MYALRHPVAITPLVANHSSSSTSDSNSNTNSSNYHTVSMLYPCPSYPGLAFACCAAALPLLQSQNTDITYVVYTLLQKALPYILEPRLPSTSTSLVLLSEIEQRRLQHLLDRFEQVITVYIFIFDSLNIPLFILLVLCVFLTDDS